MPVAANARASARLARLVELDVDGLEAGFGRFDLSGDALLFGLEEFEGDWRRRSGRRGASCVRP